MLEKINSPSDLKKLNNAEVKLLVSDIRKTILEECASGGGHLASNLGMVEATVALHRVFNSPEDAIIFDVGHQCYAHKLLTGRADKFSTLRKYGGISGFTNREESEFDALTAGHSGSALPTALGIAKANKAAGNENWAVAVIGDGSFTNGMVFEALNCCDDKDLKLLILLNDNEMSISKNVGTMPGYFSRLRNSRKYFNFKKHFQRFVSVLPGGRTMVKFFVRLKEFFKHLLLQTNIFENLGLYYLGPVSGNNESKMESLLREAMTKDKVTIIHMLTLKGNGYANAEKNPENYHFTSSFDINEGVKLKSEKSFSSVMGDYVSVMKQRNDKICAVTAAMEMGTGLSSFRDKYPESFYDVGIAEECAVTFAGGLAIGGRLPICALYSTFLQRTFDQILEDIALQKTHAVLAVDRAGLVPGDGVTHQGVFDVAMLSAVPGTTIYSPETYDELCTAFDKAEAGEGLYVVRYPKGPESNYDRSKFAPLDKDGDVLATGGEFESVIITYGRICENTVMAAERSGKKVKIIRLCKINPIDFELLYGACAGKDVLFVEEGIRRGGVGEALAARFAEMGYEGKVKIHALESGFVPHGDLASIMRHCRFTADDIAEML